MRTSTLATLSLAFLLAAACGKSGPSGSGAMSSTEKALLAYLPADGHVVFGFNFANVVDFVEHSPLAKLPTVGTPEDMASFVKCWKDVEDVTVVGSVVVGTPARLRMVVKGLTKEDFEGCVKAGGRSTARRDEGGKFLTLSRPLEDGTVQDRVFHFISDDTAYLVATADFKARGSMASVGIEELKKEVALAQKSSLASHAKLMALGAEIDRTSAVWMCGDVEGTPADDVVTKGCMSIGMTKDALTLDFFAALASAEMGTMAVQQFQMVQSQMEQIPAQMKQLKDALESVLDNAKLSFEDGTLTGHVELKNEAIEPLIGMASMMGALAP